MKKNKAIELLKAEALKLGYIGQVILISMGGSFQWIGAVGDDGDSVESYLFVIEGGIIVDDELVHHLDVTLVNYNPRDSSDLDNLILCKDRGE